MSKQAVPGILLSIFGVPMSIIEEALNKAENGKKQQKKRTESSDNDHYVLDGLESDSSQKDIEDQIYDASSDHGTAKSVVKRSAINLDWEKLRDEGFITTLDVNSKLSEEFRSIKRPLVMNAFVQGKARVNRSNLILITSSVPGEGKTFSAINLALSIANERDKKVLLIDADLAKPSISTKLGIKSSPGLIEYLEGKVNFSEVVSKTDLSGLRVIPAGQRHRFSTELLASDKMQQLCDELSQRYTDRIVIFDSPPLLAATQAEVLAGLVGQVVLVVSAEETVQSDIKMAIEKLQGSEVVLALLNKSKSDFTPYNYGAYGY